jgi:hypothetical protein
MTTTKRLKRAARRCPLARLALVAAAAVLAAVPLAGAALRHAADTGTFGQTQVGTLVDWGGPSWLDVSGPYTVSSAVSVTKLTAYVAGGPTVSHLRGVIYTDSAGKPGAFAAVTPALTINANQTAGWVDLTFTSPGMLPAGSYWLGYWYADYQSRHSYLNITGSERYAPATYSATGNPPGSFPAAGTSASSYSLYATYTTSSTPAAPVNTASPVITYSQPDFPNYVFSTTQGTWANSPTSFSYKWCWAPSDVGIIADTCSTLSTASTMTLKWPVDDGHVTVFVTAANAAGSLTAQAYIDFHASEFTVVALPTITVDGGGPPRVGSTLSAHHGDYLGVPTGAPSGVRWFSITWLRCNTTGGSCVPILSQGPGIDPTPSTLPYVLTAADVGSTIRILDSSPSVSGSSRTIAIASAPTAAVTS